MRFNPTLAWGLGEGGEGARQVWEGSRLWEKAMDAQGSTVEERKHKSVSSLSPFPSLELLSKLSNNGIAVLSHPH